MIQTTIKNLPKYQFSSNLKKAIDYFLQHKNSIAIQKVGKYEIEPSFFYLIQEYDSKPQVKWEAHKKYIDVQIILKGEECMNVSDIDYLTALGDFDSENDFQGYNGDVKACIEMTAGDLAIFFPNDAHQPGLQSKKGVSSIRKCVIKVLV